MTMSTMPVLFGTDGIRGVFGKYPITEEFFSELACALEDFSKKILKKNHLIIAIGRDTRVSGKFLQDAFIRGLSGDVQVLDCGIIPTPGVSLVSDKQNCDWGVMITASHNPFTDNGIKIFNSKGEKLTVEAEKNFEQFLETKNSALPGGCADVQDFHQQARQIFIDRFNAADFLIKTPVILDTANGATAYTSPDILKKVCPNLCILGDTPDGKNINIGCGTEHIDFLQSAVRASDGGIGIAHDGDGDRLIMVDESARCLNGDQIIGMIAQYLKHENLLPNNSVVVTEQSNGGLDASLGDLGIRVVRTDVGDRNVYYAMLKNDIILGGEESGHIILRDRACTGDAISAAMLVLKMMYTTGKSLTELAGGIKLFPKRMINLHISERVPIGELTGLTNLLDELKKYEHYKRSLIRYSGTENKLRILVEADSVQNADAIIDQIRDCTVKEFEKHKIFVK